MSGGEAGWEAATVKRGSALMMAEEVPGQVREATPRGLFGVMGERARNARGKLGHVPCAWRGAREAATCTVERSHVCRVHCGGPMRGNWTGGSREKL